MIGYKQHRAAAPPVPPTLAAQLRAILVAVFLLLCGAVSKQVPRLTLRPQRRAASLDPDRAFEEDAAEAASAVTHSRIAHLWMLADWRWVWTESGTCVMAACVLDGAWQMGSHSFERALHLHIAMGMSTGFSLALISALVVAQCAACGCLLLPAVYLATGSVAPSAVLVGTLWFEAVMFGDATDTPTLVRVGCLTLTCAMLALFRYDRQARNAQRQLPTSGALLSIEASVRRACSCARTGIALPPLALLTIAWAVGCNPYWRRHGIEHEWLRGRFHAALALAAVLLLTSGQDTKAHAVIGDRLELIYDAFMKRKEDLLGHPRQVRFLGAKKAL